MKHKPEDIQLQVIQEFDADKTLLNRFLIFDNYSQSTDDWGIFSVKGYPTKLDSVFVIMCSKGFARMIVGFEEFVVKADNFLVVLEGKPFEVKEISDDFKADFICLKADFFEMKINHLLDFLHLIRDKPCHPILHSHKKIFDDIFAHIKQIMRETDNVFRQQIVQHYIYIMAFSICNLLTKSYKPISLSRSESIFQDFITQVEKHFRQERNMSFYAGKLNLTPKYLSTVIFKLTGKHATDWISDYTILESKALLKSSGRSIQQIAYDLNFSNQSHFGRYFRTYTGMSPKEYRKL